MKRSYFFGGEEVSFVDEKGTEIFSKVYKFGKSLVHNDHVQTGWGHLRAYIKPYHQRQRQEVLHLPYMLYLALLL